MSGRVLPGAGPRRAPARRHGAGRRGPGGTREAGQLELEGQPGRDVQAARALALAPAIPAARDVRTAPPIPAAVPAGDGSAYESSGHELREAAREERRRRRARERAAKEPGPVAAQPADGELSGLRLLLDQLDALLRDPTLNLWLKAAAAKVGAGLREAGAALAEVARNVVRALVRLRIPRAVLLGLLALLLPLALLALLSGDDRAAREPAAGPAAEAGGFSLPSAGMPDLTLASEKPGPVNVALVLDRTYDPAALRRELGTLGSWLEAHHAPGTRVSLIDASSGRASAATDPGQLAGARAALPRASTTAAVRSALSGRDGRRLLVMLGDARAPAGGASALSIATSRGASGAPSVALRRGGRSRVTIDDRRPDALAASVARAIMAISGQSERR